MAKTGYDQLSATGSVNLGGALLQLSDLNAYFSGQPQSATLGKQFTLINNMGSSPSLGTFAGLNEGATFFAADSEFSITYEGGDGNDVVLTVVPECGVLSVAPAILFLIRRRPRIPRGQPLRRIPASS